MNASVFNDQSIQLDLELRKVFGVRAPLDCGDSSPL